MDFPALPLEIKLLNQQLISHFGIDTDNGDAMWRVSWSKDQYEKRMSNYTATGVELLHEEVMLLPKYNYINPPCWLLERLCLVPTQQKRELVDITKSYECIYAFHEVTPNPPSFEACKFVVDCIYAAMGRESMRHYIDEEAVRPIETREARIAKLTEELFGDESMLLGRTITGEAVGYTGEPRITDTSKKE